MMKKIRCRHCQAALRLPPGFGDTAVKCPKCNGKTTLPTNENGGDAVSGDDGHNVGKSMPGAQTRPISPHAPSESPAIESSGSHTSGSQQTKTSIWARLWQYTDVRFEHYMTPWIIRFTWVCVMVLVLFWVVMLAGSTILSWVPGGPTSTMQRSIDPNSLDPGNLDKMLENLDVSSLLGQSLLGGSGRARPGFLGAVEQFGWGVFKFVTIVISIVLFVLWSRVMLETLIVIFDISNTLKRIENQAGERPGDGRPS